MDENVCIRIMGASETVSTLLTEATREQFTAFLLPSFLLHALDILRLAR